MLAAAEKLKGELAATLLEIERSCKEAFQALEAQLNTYVQLTRLKKVYEKVQSKEYYLVE